MLDLPDMDLRVYCGFAGCKVNQFERSLLLEQLADAGFSNVDEPGDAGFIVYNTCCVTKNAEVGCRQALRAFHRRNPAARIVVTGCYAQRSAETLRSLPGVALVIGNDGKDALVAELRRLAGIATDARRPAPLSYRFRHRVRERARAHLKIQDGCDAFCAYCIVPSVRGAPVSMDAELVIENLRGLEGEREVVLTGIHLGRWGADHGTGLARLMRRIADERLPFRIRLSSLEPTELTDELLDILAAMPGFCPHFHIPVQSGSARVLGMMNRTYGPGAVIDAVRRVRATFPDAGIGADVIAAFPGEQEADFADSLSLLKAVPIDYLHAFRFSPREGTKAFTMPGRVPEGAARDRMDRLRALDAAKRGRFAARFVGKPVRCIVDRRDGGVIRAVTREYLKLHLDRDPGDVEADAVVTSAGPPAATLR